MSRLQRYNSPVNPKYGVIPLDTREGYALAVLTRLRRRMQMKSLKHLQDWKERKKFGYDSRKLIRAHTWELAYQMLDKEMEGLEWLIKKKDS